MRRKHALVLFACLATGLAVAPFARTQDDGIQAYYWPHRTVGIPVNVEQIGKLNSNKPSDLQLYYSLNRGAFQKGPKLALGSLQSLDGNKKGFLFSADRDGDYEFTVQFIYSDGSTNPRAEELSAQQRIIVDTTAPQVRLIASNNGVEWQATDENLDPRGVTLQCKWPASREWTTVTDRPFRTADRFAWKLDPGKVLEVRVMAKDRAGHETVSPIVRVPPDGATGAAFPRTNPGIGNSDLVSGPAPNLPQARIDYVNTLKFDVDYTIGKMGPSGVKAAHLFVQKPQGDWMLVKHFPQSIMPGDKEQSLALPFEAKEEGTYGFYVIPESGAGKRIEDPKRGDQPMLHVVVDTTPPFVQITGVQVRPGTRGPQVEITWKAADPNLMPEPISLEWSLDAKATKWNEIKYRLRNNLTLETGRHVWEVPDEKLWKFYVRARAVDKASNSGEHIWGQDSQKKNPPAEVIVDLETPAGTINRARGANTVPDPPGTRPAGGSDAPPRPPVGNERPTIPDLPP